ncbi:hypothetical protein CDL15_Pgr005626 [Punica granatum]|uniref:Uncharacterized protein n=1 Tax=Punica granatum TaxID=22663 RepID=A0A218WG39_PUNGR|nr:hypothetical protein CDL15_Pgr005626 [Punica granatum]
MPTYLVSTKTIPMPTQKTLPQTCQAVPASVAVVGASSGDDKANERGEGQKESVVDEENDGEGEDGRGNGRGTDVKEEDEGRGEEEKKDEGRGGEETKDDGGSDDGCRRRVDEGGRL